LLWLLIWGAPLTTLAEPRRGTEWWGKDLLVTLGLFVWTGHMVDTCAGTWLTHYGP